MKPYNSTILTLFSWYVCVFVSVCLFSGWWFVLLGAFQIQIICCIVHSLRFRLSGEIKRKKKCSFDLLFHYYYYYKEIGRWHFFLFAAWRRPWLENSGIFLHSPFAKQSTKRKKKKKTDNILKKAPPLFSFDLNALNSHWEMAFFSLFAAFLIFSTVKSRFALSLATKRST